MNKKTIFYFLVFVFVCLLLLFIESIDNDDIFQSESQSEFNESEYNETMRCIEWSGMITQQEYVGNVTGLYRVNNYTESFNITRNKIEFLDMNNELYQDLIKRQLENCSSVNIVFLFDEYGLNAMHWDTDISIYFNQNRSRLFSDYIQYTSEFESDVCLEYIKTYERIN